MFITTPKGVPFPMPCLADSIRHIDPALQELVVDVEQAPSLTRMILAAGQLARWLVILLVQEVLAQRAQQPTAWPTCPRCGTRLRSKGFLPRQLTTLLGIVRWERRVGRCPQGCKIGQVAPLDEQLGLTPIGVKRTSPPMRVTLGRWSTASDACLSSRSGESALPGL